MAKNWTAYEAAVELYGTNKENIAEIGSRYPLFTRSVCMAGNEYLLDILKALPKVTARVVETGLKEMDGITDALGVSVDVDIDVEDEVEDVADEKAEKKPSKKTSAKKEADEDAAEDYESMTATALYKLCCSRGISSHCKSRSKAALIEVLEAHDRGELESTKDSGKKEKAKPAKKSAPKKEAEPEEDADDWEDEEDEQEDPYAGKTAMELYKECKKRGIKAKPKMKAADYAKLLKEDDEAEEPEEDGIEDDDDDWEI